MAALVAREKEYIMGLYSTFKTDTNLEVQGIWLEYGLVDGDMNRPIRIKVSRAGGSNTRFARLLEAKTKPHRRSIQTETLDPKLAEQMFKEVYAESIILDWVNVQDEEGNDLPFSRDNVIKVLSDLPDLWADVREQCNKVALFRQTILENDSGN